MADVHSSEEMALLKKITRRRQDIQNYLDKLQPESSLLTNVTVLFGALATVFTVTPAIGGKAVLALIGEASLESPAWRWLFALAASFSFLSTLAANLYKNKEIATRLAKAQGGNAKLDGIGLRLELRQLSVDKAVEEYTKVSQEISFVPDNIHQPSKNVVDVARGKIQFPVRGQEIQRTFECSGSAENLMQGCHLWLAVEIDGRIWPKECEILPDDKGNWQCIVSEEGAAASFSLSLYAANDAASRKIRKWLDKCVKKGDYVELRRTAGMNRLYRVDGLHK